MENSRLRAYAQAENDYADAHAELLNNYRLEKKAEQDSIYNDAMTTIDSQTWNTTADLENYVKGFEGKVSDAQWSELQNRLNFYKNDTDQQAADVAYEKEQVKQSLAKSGVTKVEGVRFNANPVYNKDKDEDGEGDHYKKGDNFTVTDGTDEYKVQFGTYLSGDELKSIEAAVGEHVADNEVFKYGNKLYMRRNGKYYEITGRALDKEGYNALLELYG